ncbi:hypothetical protein CWE15_10510 [Aliidiomarina taiwanensis]|uniref:Sensor domain-containing diguanylate cyclase n=1 Tax=Aliidiomarina taiwanensis TaxID=946228 RepID=A0A432WYS6_9GAMM|nr:sensor domain-containing diguanylate cyclase [Aliidiomarina taiwanensis]RUO38925.1 hypothetical protein CWE15_10510 [Aliidiomarina taiwanensis]
MSESTKKDQLFWLEAIIEGAQVGTWLWNHETGEARYNERWAEILGYSLSELEPLSADTWKLRTHPDDLPRVETTLTRYLAGEIDSYSFDTRMQHKNGHWVWVRDRGKIVTRTEDGKPEWLAGAHVDITDEKTNNERLDRLFKISENIPGTVYEFKLMPDGTRTFPYASPGIKKLFGVTLEEAKRDADTVFSRIHPDDLQEVNSSIQDSAETLDIWFTEFRVVLSTGEKWLTGHATPERHSDGSISWYGQVVDSTFEKQMRLEVEQQRKELTQAQRIGLLGYWRANMDTGELYWSDMIFEIFGLDTETFKPSIDGFTERVHPEDLNLVRASEERAQKSGVHDVVHRIIRPNGEVRWVHELADFKGGEKDRILVGTVRDITLQKQYEKELERLSLTDELTGAYNRRFSQNRLTVLFEKVKKRDAKSCIALLDVDHFKHVNDEYGHDVGDQVLQQLVKFLQSKIRSTDTMARFGGEEFILIMEDAEPEGAYQRVRIICADLEQTPIVTEKGELKVTITAGVTQISEHDEDVNAALKRADNALYQGKKAGRNRVVMGTR